MDLPFCNDYFGKHPASSLLVDSPHLCVGTFLVISGFFSLGQRPVVELSATLYVFPGFKRQKELCGEPGSRILKEGCESSRGVVVSSPLKVENAS